MKLYKATSFYEDAVEKGKTWAAVEFIWLDPAQIEDLDYIKNRIAEQSWSNDFSVTNIELVVIPYPGDDYALYLDSDRTIAVTKMQT
jgi:hypothetical protein